ncbi:isochorismatase family protein [Duganella sp. CY15W]|uniref:cysteine hydrolase family protein n=1 Tax=Duganella sp. CY15W TaxID=2692172 RepID=UPI00136CBB35|nr:cysteine hydrolase family protein [Duganella sp. CY15W]MYM30778.1 isochorismatase family protein [Duganella sp. CY15W]
MRAALMVIDFQNAVFTESPAGYQADVVMERIRKLIAKARASGTQIIYIQHDEAGTEWALNGKGWAFPEAIAPQAGDFVSPKNQCDGFFNTGLTAFLNEQEIQRLVICGFATEFCVDTNVRHAASSGYPVTLAMDAHTTRDRAHLNAASIIEHHNATWRNFGGIQLLNSEEIVF